MENENSFEKPISLNKLIGEIIAIQYPDRIFHFGKLIKSEVNERNYFHIAFKHLDEKEKPCIKTIFLREEYLKFFKKDSGGIILYSINDFCPIWTHYKNNSDKEYLELEKILN